MIAPDKGLTAYCDRYLLARSVSVDYAQTTRQRIAAYCEWCGADVPIGALCAEHVNEWLAELAESGLSAWSLSGYRGALLAVWNEAFKAGDNNNPPLRVRLIRKPRLVVEAYTHDEIRRLLVTAGKLTATHKDGNRAADFWQAAIHVAYCCGPRRGDLLAVKRSQVSPTGLLSFVQHKTQYPHRVQLSTEAVQLCSRLQGDKLLPWPHDDDWFTRRFNQLRKLAGVHRGTFRWIRRSAGSYAERDSPGAGARLLGHRDASVFQRYYNDSSISEHQPPEPPPLG